MMNATRQALAAIEMSVKVADLRRTTYDPQWVYINRIGTKARIIREADAIHNGGTIRAAIKITWNPDAYTREQVARYVQRLLPAINHFATMGSVHPFRRCGEVGHLLSGGLDESRPNVWHMKGYTVPTEQEARTISAKIRR